MIGNILGGALSGFGAGASLGPWGAGIGAVLGGAAGLFGGGGGSSSSTPNTSAAFYAPPMGPTSYRNVLGDYNKEAWQDFKGDLSEAVSKGYYTPDQAYQMAIQGKSGPSKFSASFLKMDPDEDSLSEAAEGVFRSFGIRRGSGKGQVLMKRYMDAAKNAGIRDFGSMTTFVQNQMALDPENRYRGPLSETDYQMSSLYGQMVPGDNKADKTYRYTFNPNTFGSSRLSR